MLGRCGCGHVKAPCEVGRVSGSSRPRESELEIVRFDIPVGPTEPDQVGAWCQSFVMSRGEGPFTIRNVHMTAAAEGEYRASFAAKICPDDYLFVVLKGSGAVSSNNSKGEVPIRAGQGAYFKAEEGYVIYADEELIGVMIGARSLSLSAGIDDRPIPYAPVNIYNRPRAAAGAPTPRKTSLLRRLVRRVAGPKSDDEERATGP
jgi:hypothetical protein